MLAIRDTSSAYLPDFVITISVPASWKMSQRPLFSSVTLTDPYMESGCIKWATPCLPITIFFSSLPFLFRYALGSFFSLLLLSAKIDVIEKELDFGVNLLGLINESIFLQKANNYVRKRPEKAALDTCCKRDDFQHLKFKLQDTDRERC